VTEVQIRRLANFITLNQENPNYCYRKDWVHQLRRSKHSLHVADHRVIPVICCRFLRNLNAFQNQLTIVGQVIKNTPKKYKMVDIADLKQVLSKWNLTYVSQSLFLEEFTRKGQVNVINMIERMKVIVKNAYKLAPELQA